MSDRGKGRNRAVRYEFWVCLGSSHFNAFEDDVFAVRLEAVPPYKIVSERYEEGDPIRTEVEYADKVTGVYGPLVHSEIREESLPGFEYHDEDGEAMDLTGSRSYFTTLRLTS